MALIEWVVPETMYSRLKTSPSDGSENTTYYRDSEARLLLVEYEENVVRSRKGPGRPRIQLEENSQIRSEAPQDSFLICDDCKHNTITYEPAKDGSCDCGCH